MNFLKSITFYPILPWWLILAFLGLTVFLAAMRPGFGKLSSGKRFVILVLRMLAALLLVFAIIRPGMIRNDFRKQNATVLVALDKSKSMTLPATDKDSRYALARRILKQIKARETEFHDKGMELKLYGFDQSPEPLIYFQNNKKPGKNSTIQLPQKADGKQTDVIAAVGQTIRANLNKRVMSVILLSDGTQNVAQPKSSAMEVGQTLKAKKIALHPFLLGQTTQAGAFTDAAVSTLPDSLAGFAENQVEFRASVRFQGMDGQKVPVQLWVQKPGGTEELVDTKIVNVQGQSMTKAVDFLYLPKDPGEYKVWVKIPKQPKESVLGNNQLKSYLQAFPGGLKIVYVTGNLQFEHKFIVRSLQASQDINVKTYWEDSRQIDQWPKDYSKLFSDPTVDVFVLDNIDSAALWSPRFEKGLKALEKAVAENNKGLLMMGGYHSFGPGGYAETPVANMLPVRIYKSERQRFDGPLRIDTQLPGPVSLVKKRDHFVTRITSNDGQTPLDFSKLPKLLGGNEFARREIKPSASILLESENGDPLLVAGNYGGRVMAFSGNSTYLWVRKGFREPHQRFWRQMMLWLASRDTASNKNVWLRLSKRRLNLGEGLSILAGVRDSGGDRLNGVQLSTTLTGPDGQKSSLAFTEDMQKKLFKTELDQSLLSAGGTYKIQITASIDGKVIGTESQEFDVKDVDNEIIQSVSDPTLVRQMTEASSEAGGKIWESNQVDDLIDQLLEQATSLQIKIPKLWRFGDNASDAISILLCFFVVMMAEWFLRKKWGLV